MEVISAIKERACIRAFTDQQVADSTIEQILDTARWSPSGGNTQPWQVAVVKAKTCQKMGDAITEARRNNQLPDPDYNYYPQQWVDPYKKRRVECGMALYNALGIKREDSQRRNQVWEWNYYFFHAPVGLFFFVDDVLEKGSWVDMGMFIQSIMLAARGYGLETCPQASLAEYPNIVRHILDISPNNKLICGMSLGYPDREAAINQYRTAREEVASFTRWYE